MKKIIFATTIITSLFITACAGIQPIPEHEKTFEKIVETPGLTKDKIYLSTKIWLAETFKSSKAVIEVDSKPDGLIIGNGIISYPCQGMNCIGTEGWKVPFTMKIEIKDEKFKMTFTNIRISTPGQIGVYPAAENPISQQGDMDKIKPALLKLADELLAAANGSSAKKDW